MLELSVLITGNLVCKQVEVAELEMTLRSYFSPNFASGSCPRVTHVETLVSTCPLVVTLMLVLLGCSSQRGWG